MSYWLVEVEEELSAVADEVRSRRPVTIVAITIAVVAIVGIGVVLFLNLRSDSQDLAIAGVKVTEPGDSTVSGDGFIIRGTSRNLANGTYLWVVTKGVDPGSTFQPENKPCVVSDDGKWECPPTFVGGDSDAGKSFEIKILGIDESARQVFLKYDREKPPNQYPGIPSLPSGATELAHFTVQRA